MSAIDDPGGRLELAWRTAPLAMDFVLDMEAASRNTSDLVNGLLFAAIQSANVAAISADPQLQLRYAMLSDTPPTDDLRRPVSVNAIAQSLRMPFETARRRVHGLAKLGVVEVTAKGVLVAQRTLGHPMFLTNVFLRHDHLKAFYLRMIGLDVFVLPPPADLPPWREPPVRLTNRLIWEYMLRAADGLGALVGDTTNGLILLAMVRENTEGLTPAEIAAWAADPPAHARPVRNSRLAGRLNLSTETLRRYVIRLADQGLCLRGPNGLAAIAPPGFRDRLDHLVLDNYGNLQRLLTRLRQFGVGAMWEAEALAA